MRNALRTSGIIGLALALGLIAAPISAAVDSPGPPTFVPESQFSNVPRASCGPGSTPETGLQGQVPALLRSSGFKGFSCNLQLLSQYAGQGAEWVGSWAGHCFYMSTASGPNQTNKGVAVIDVSDSTNIKYVKSLSSPAFLNTWESLKWNPKRNLLAGTGRTTPFFDVYDVSKDCTNPTLEASIDLGPLGWGHEGNWAPDGMTYYADPLRSCCGGLSASGLAADPDPHLGFIAIDVSKPNNPKVITTWDLPLDPPTHLHGLEISPDGTRGYLMVLSATPNNSENGLMIVDLSQIQARKPNPQVKVLSYLPWRDNNLTQMAQWFRSGGRTYLLATDELGSGSCANPQDPSKLVTGLGPCQYKFGWPQACDGYPPFAYGRIIDITDERVPTIVSKLRLEVQDPKNCPQMINDRPQGSGTFGYDSHYCTVDNPENPAAAACGYFESGVRVFDIRDPNHPKEIAYYNPPSNPSNSGLAQAGSYDADPPVDWAASGSRFYHAPNGSWELWIQTQENGAQILRFTNGVYPLKAAASPTATATGSGGLSPAGWLGLVGLFLELVVLGALVLRRRTAKT
jgi:hypothetical protein